MRELLDKSHPVWRVLLNMVWLGMALAVTASDFDASELKTLALFLAGNGVVERTLKG